MTDITQGKVIRLYERLVRKEAAKENHNLAERRKAERRIGASFTKPSAQVVKVRDDRRSGKRRY